MARSIDMFQSVVVEPAHDVVGLVPIWEEGHEFGGSDIEARKA
jgi:hypothetical protein